MKEMRRSIFIKLLLVTCFLIRGVAAFSHHHDEERNVMCFNLEHSADDTSNHNHYNHNQNPSPISPVECHTSTTTTMQAKEVVKVVDRVTITQFKRSVSDSARLLHDAEVIKNTLYHIDHTDTPSKEYLWVNYVKCVHSSRAPSIIA